MPRLKIITVGTSQGVILTKEVLALLKAKKGDTLNPAEAPEGGFGILPHDPEFERQMTLAEGILRDDKDILRDLATI